MIGKNLKDSIDFIIVLSLTLGLTILFILASPNIVPVPLSFYFVEQFLELLLINPVIIAALLLFGFFSSCFFFSACSRRFFSASLRLASFFFIVPLNFFTAKSLISFYIYNRR